MILSLPKPDQKSIVLKLSAENFPEDQIPYLLSLIESTNNDDINALIFKAIRFLEGKHTKALISFPHIKETRKTNFCTK